MKRWINQLGVFAGWLTNVLLAFWIMVVLRNAMLSALQAWYVGSSIPRSWRARAWNQLYFVVSGLVYLIFIFLVDGYLRDGLKRHDTFRRFAKVAGIELLIVFGGELLTSIARQSLFGQLSLLLMALEFAGGVALLAYAILHQRAEKTQLTRGENV